MNKQPDKFDWIAWYTSIPGIPAGWPAPKPRPAKVTALKVPEPDPQPPALELPAAA